MTPHYQVTTIIINTQMLYHGTSCSSLSFTQVFNVIATQITSSRMALVCYLYFLYKIEALLMRLLFNMVSQFASEFSTISGHILRFLIA